MRPALSLLALLLASPAAADTLVVGNKGENSVSFVDLDSGRTVATRETGPAPHEIALSPDGRRAAVVEYGGNGILIFDVATGRRLERIDLGENDAPHGLLWLRDGRLIATAEGSGTLVTVLADAPAGTAGRVYAVPTAGEQSHMVAVHHGGRAFVANMASGNVSDIDLDGQREPVLIQTGGAPEGIALSADGGRLWVADRDGGTVAVIDVASRSIQRRIPVGRTPIRIALTPDGRQAVVSNFRDGTLTVIDTKRLTARTVPVSGEPDAQQVTILFSADGRRLYVAETGRNQVAEIDWPSGRILRRIDVGRQGDGLGLSAVDTRPN